MDYDKCTAAITWVMVWNMQNLGNVWSSRGFLFRHPNHVHRRKSVMRWEMPHLHVITTDTIKRQPQHGANQEKALLSSQDCCPEEDLQQCYLPHTYSLSLSLFYSLAVIIVPYNASLRTWLGCQCGLFPHSACWVYISDSSPRHRLQGPSMWDMPLGLSLSFSLSLLCLNSHMSLL